MHGNGHGQIVAQFTHDAQPVLQQCGGSIASRSDGAVVVEKDAFTPRQPVPLCVACGLLPEQTVVGGCVGVLVDGHRNLIYLILHLMGIDRFRLGGNDKVAERLQSIFDTFKARPSVEGARVNRSHDLGISAPHDSHASGARCRRW